MSRPTILIDSRKILRDFPPSERYLIAVSGGRDSVALLNQLVDLGYKNLVVCHLNHQLRGRSSNADARFVKKLADRYRNKIVRQAYRLPNGRQGKRSACPTTTIGNIDLAVGLTNVRQIAAKNKMSIETAARNARYKFFAKIAKQKKCRAIFLAHHADDLVETFLLNLFRGAGMTGLSAMRQVSIRRIEDVDLTIVRPFLGTQRAEIDNYICAHRLKFREDASNKNLTPLRNRIRHRVIPYLEKIFGRSVRKNIWRTATIAAEEESFFETLLPGKMPTLLVRPLREMSVALQRRTLHKWLRDENVSDIGFDLIERIRELLDFTARVAKTNLPQDRHVRRRAGKLFVE